MSLPAELRSTLQRWLPFVALIALAMIVLASCAGPAASPGASGAPPITPEPTPLVPAQPGADPLSLLAWLFTPIFQGLFILLTGLYVLIGDIAIAIILMTLVIRAIMIPLFRRQTVSQRRMQLLQPEIKEVQRRYKGDRTKISQATMELYRERGVNPAAGCLPLVLQFILLIPMYSVIQNGLTNYDPTAMLTVFGQQVVPLVCPNPEHIDAVTGAIDKSQPCIDTIVPWLNNMDVSKPSVLFALPVIGGLSLLAVVAALLQVVQSRMVMPPAGDKSDTQANVQRQTMLIFPLISVAYGGFLPAGLFIYWIVTTLFSIVQQYLIVGWGQFFPLFGRTPAFAREHQPRFPVAMPTAQPRPPSSKGGSPSGKGAAAEAPRVTSTERAASAAATVRPRERGRQGRRGRRR
jgi:YidC/Oxa1 family membrane protein insertase